MWLSEIGLYYYKARIYSPTLGRFLQTDPIGYEDQVNLYAYVGNDPVNAVDVTGKRTTCMNGNTYCVTFVEQVSQRTNTKIASNAKPEDALLVQGNRIGNSNLDTAASEVAQQLNQTGGNERVYRMDTYDDVPGLENIVITTEIATQSSTPSGASFDVGLLSGAAGSLHTEPTGPNSSVPGSGDWQVPATAGVANYQAYGQNANAIEVANGAVQISTIDHNETEGLNSAAREMQRKMRKHCSSGDGPTCNP